MRGFGLGLGRFKQHVGGKAQVVSVTYEGDHGSGYTFRWVFSKAFASYTNGVALQIDYTDGESTQIPSSITTHDSVTLDVTYPYPIGDFSPGTWSLTNDGGIVFPHGLTTGTGSLVFPAHIVTAHVASVIVSEESTVVVTFDTLEVPNTDDLSIWINNFTFGGNSPFSVTGTGPGFIQFQASAFPDDPWACNQILSAFNSGDTLAAGTGTIE